MKRQRLGKGDYSDSPETISSRKAMSENIQRSVNSVKGQFQGQHWETMKNMTNEARHGQ